MHTHVQDRILLTTMKYFFKQTHTHCIIYLTVPICTSWETVPTLWTRASCERWGPFAEQEHWSFFSEESAQSIEKNTFKSSLRSRLVSVCPSHPLSLPPPSPDNLQHLLTPSLPTLNSHTTQNGFQYWSDKNHKLTSWQHVTPYSQSSKTCNTAN